MEPSFSFVDLMSFSVFCCSRFSNFLSDPIGKQNAMSKREAKKHFPMKVSDGKTKTNVSNNDETRQLDLRRPVEREELSHMRSSLHDPLPAECIYKVISQNGDRILFERLPTLRPAPTQQQQQQQQHCICDDVSTCTRKLVQDQSGIRDVRGYT